MLPHPPFPGSGLESWGLPGASHSPGSLSVAQACEGQIRKEECRVEEPEGLEPPQTSWLLCGLPSQGSCSE